MKILLIEDDRELADSMRFQLEKEGYETDICDDGEEGLYYMKERSHDLVILDRMLPSMDGITVLQEARKNHVSTPVIMLTALGELQDKLTGLKGNGKECTLSKREGALLELMLRNAGQTLPREVILNRVWGADSEVEDGNLDNYIHFLRRRLKSVRSTLNLKTVRGIGYRLEN